MLRRIAKTGRLVLTEEESKRFLTTYGIPVVRQETTHNVDEALAAAKAIGYPVVLKVVSHDITHKNAAGGVEVGICSPEDLERSYEQLLERVKLRAPDAEIEGVSVQMMVRHIDYELILGMKKDQQFGSVIIFGSGGVGAEGLADFSVSLPPLNPVLARRMMEETRIYRSLSEPPTRRRPARPRRARRAHHDAVQPRGRLPRDRRDRHQPGRRSREGKPVAVDARIIIDQSVLDGSPETPHLVITPYPTRFVSPWKLTDGTEVLLRPIKSEDEPMIAEMLATMSEESLHDRFFEGVPEFDARPARALHQHRLRARAGHRRRAHDQGRQAHHRCRAADRGPGARRTASSPSSCTTSSTDGASASSWSTSSSASPRSEGFKRLVGTISADNQRMLDLVEELGFSAVSTEDGVTRVRLDLG